MKVVVLIMVVVMALVCGAAFFPTKMQRGVEAAFNLQRGFNSFYHLVV
jgi:hypothetical protein